MITSCYILRESNHYFLYLTGQILEPGEYRVVYIASYTGGSDIQCAFMLFIQLNGKVSQFVYELN